MKVSDTPYRFNEVFSSEKPMFLLRPIEDALHLLGPMQILELQNGQMVYITVCGHCYRLRNSLMGIWMDI
jgi:hypothetical protein